VAFIRRKKVHGHHYYQAVRNYRDKNGKHRQEVLCHLGLHSSLDATIDAERKKAKVFQELALSHRTRAKHLRDTILERHGWELPNGEIPNVAETTR
jgi:alkanesulfonate monooxygenase SsuD/methylene tetrahydromethanopterin reductase-like flavin-dependent oxidoreductase (luciferase family)